MNESWLMDSDVSSSRFAFHQRSILPQTLLKTNSPFSSRFSSGLRCRESTAVYENDRRRTAAKKEFGNIEILLLIDSRVCVFDRINIFVELFLRRPLRFGQLKRSFRHFIKNPREKRLFGFVEMHTTDSTAEILPHFSNSSRNGLEKTLPVSIRADGSRSDRRR